MSPLTSIVFAFCFIQHLSVISVFGAKECYQCSTATKPQCADLSDITGIEKCQTTAGSDINCLMYEYMLNGRKITYRGCRTKSDTCDDVKNALEKEFKEYVSCSLCDTDLCKDGIKKSAPGAASVDVPVIGLTLIGLILMKLMT